MDSTKVGRFGQRSQRVPCGCGCGELAPLHRSGWPQSFISGHQNRKPLSFLVQDCGYETPCYVWRGSTANNGYATFTRNGRKYAAHRQVILAFTEEPLPDNWEACHRCDNPPCVRPDHLFAGTRADNVHDMIQKGREYRGERSWVHAPNPANRGERHAKARLKKEDVRKIRAAYARGGTSERKLAADFDVSRGAVRRVLTGTAWGWLDD